MAKPVEIPQCCETPLHTIDLLRDKANRCTWHQKYVTISPDELRWLLRDATTLNKLISEAHYSYRHSLTEAQARELAKHDRQYVARQNGPEEWIVWDCVSDHRVEFN